MGGIGTDGFDAVVVGSGPNGLVGAVRLAEAGRRVLLVEAQPTLGGGLRTEELTLPGFRHDVCATALPLALASPAFRALDPTRDGVEFRHPPLPAAHPLDDGPAALVQRDVDATAAAFGGRDGAAWRAVVGATARAGFPLVDTLLSPLDLPPHAPLAALRFGVFGALPATVTGALFREPAARAAFAGMAAHSILDLRSPVTAGYGLLLAALAHSVGWPVVRGGTQSLADALVARLHRAGAEIVTGCRVRDLGELPPAPVTVLDLTPRQVLEIAGDRLPPRLPAAVGALPLRSGRLQARLRPRRARAVVRPGRRGRGHGPPGRHRGGGRRRRAGRGPRAAPGPPVRARRPGLRGRPHAGPGGSSTPSGPTATCRTGRTST